MKINNINTINFQKRQVARYSVDNANKDTEYYLYQINPTLDKDYFKELRKEADWKTIDEDIIMADFMYLAGDKSLSNNKYSTFTLEDRKFHCLGVVHIIDNLLENTRSLMLLINPGLNREEKNITTEIFRQVTNKNTEE